jgi:predicted acylesterase/phospholipase RssA
MSSERPKVSMCLGGGGAFGVGLHFGVARAFADAGLPLNHVVSIGTSAGAWAAAALALDIDLETVMKPWEVAPAKRFGHRSVDTVRPVFGSRRAASVTTVAVALRSMRRVLLSAAEYGITDVVAASSSPPPFAVAHEVDGRRYIDAGLISVCSADLAPSADLLIVVAPLGGPHMSASSRLFERQTVRHMKRWKQRHGGDVLYIRPNRALAAIAGHGVSGLFDPQSAAPAADAGYQVAADRIAAFRRGRERTWLSALSPPGSSPG